MSEYNFKKLFKDAEKSEQYKAEVHFLAVGEIVAGLIKERDKYRKALEEITPICGIPNAQEACRLIVKICQETLKR